MNNHTVTLPRKELEELEKFAAIGKELIGSVTWRLGPERDHTLRRDVLVKLVLHGWVLEKILREHSAPKADAYSFSVLESNGENTPVIPIRPGI